MNIFFTIKSDLESGSYYDVDFWREVELGGRPFIYLYNKERTQRAFIAVEDILRITIEESKDE